MSKIEDKFEQIFISVGVNYIREKTFQELKNGTLRYDFYLPTLGILVEVDSMLRRNINGYNFFDFFIKIIYNIYRKVKKGGIKMFFDDFDLGFSPEELEELFDEDYLEDAENFYKEEGTDYQAFFYADIDR